MDVEREDHYNKNLLECSVPIYTFSTPKGTNNFFVIHVMKHFWGNLLSSKFPFTMLLETYEEIRCSEKKIGKKYPKHIFKHHFRLLCELIEHYGYQFLNVNNGSVTFIFFSAGLAINTYWLPVIIPVGLAGNILSLIIMLQPNNR